MREGSTAGEVCIKSIASNNAQKPILPLDCARRFWFAFFPPFLLPLCFVADRSRRESSPSPYDLLQEDFPFHACAMGQPSHHKPPPRTPFLHASSNWKGKPRTRNPNPNPNHDSLPNRRPPNPPRPSSWSTDHVTGTSYQPPRLKDLQFQNRLKATRFFNPKRFTRRNDPSFTEASTSGARNFPSDAPASGFFLDLSLPGPNSRSLFHPAKGVANEPSSELRAIHTTGKGAMWPAGPRFSAKRDACTVFSSDFGSGPLDLAAAGTKASDLAVSAPRTLEASNFTGAGVPRPAGKGKVQHKRRRNFQRPAPRVSQAPAAPRNTTSFLMRAKKSGGIASFVSPSPVTPAVIQTPVVSPLSQFRGLADEANQEWGVDGYGSMNGLIKLRSSSEIEHEDFGDNEVVSDVEQGAQSVQKVEERLDHDVSRFVMTYPHAPQDLGQNLLETRMDDQDSHIAHLEEENLDLKERLYAMQREVEELRRRMHVLEGVGSNVQEEEADSTGRMTADISCL